MAAAFIGDGYTLAGRIAARLPLHGEINFRYRPALPERVYVATRGLSGKPADDFRAELKLALEHLVDWDLTDKDDQPAPINEARLRHLPHPVLQSILLHVQGYAVTEMATDEKNS